MRTPKFTPQDLVVLNEVFARGVSVKNAANHFGCSYLTMLKIKNGTYKPNTREGAKSGLPSEQADLS